MWWRPNTASWFIRLLSAKSISVSTSLPASSDAAICRFRREMRSCAIGLSAMVKDCVRMNSWLTCNNPSSMPGPVKGGYSLTDSIAPKRSSACVGPCDCMVRLEKCRRELPT